MKKTWHIASIEVKNPLVLAPMAGYTDSPYRRICKRFGAGLLYSDLISSLGVCFNNVKTMHMLERHPEETPLSLQLFGAIPEKMALASKTIQDKGFELIDINMGCPAPKIIKNGCGGALLKDPALIRAILSAVVQSVSIPVTVKIRIGFELDECNAEEVAQIAQECGIKAIAVHGSTVVQGSKGKKNWDAIKAVKECVSIPVIANGGVKSVRNFFEIMDYTKADAVMIGRAIMGKPWFFQQILRALDGEDPEILDREKPDPNMLFSIVYDHFDLQLAYYQDEILAVREMRKHLHSYFHGLPESCKIRDLVNKAKSKTDLLQLLRNYQNTFF
jgi:tRNA-dihydrouridine synthase B